MTAVAAAPESAKAEAAGPWAVNPAFGAAIVKNSGNSICQIRPQSAQCRKHS